MSTHPKALIYRASHRGTKENDIILGPFAALEVEGMDEHMRGVFAAFLECPDEDIYYWVRQESQAPEIYTELVDRIKKFVYKK